MPSKNTESGIVLWLAWLTALAMLMMTAAHGVDAHKAVTSKYTYNDDVFPILRDKCGQCHTKGGSAPMSLLTYSVDGGAVAWAESMREMLLAEAMPPWYADPTGPAVKNNHALTPRELDILVTWAAGGTPQGPLEKNPVAPAADFAWALGTPDIELPMPQPASLPPGEMEKDVDVAIPVNAAKPLWVKAVDLKPGTPSMVRQATITDENGAVLALWEPAHDPNAAPVGAAFRISAGATLRLHLHYKKPWEDEQQNMSDRSTVGLYLTDAPPSGHAITASTIDAPGPGEAASPGAFNGSLAAAGRVIALRPSLDQPYAAVEVTATPPSGPAVELLKLRAPRPEWPRRYWLVTPVALPAGTRIEVKTLPGDPDTGPLVKEMHRPLQMALDIVPQ